MQIIIPLAQRDTVSNYCLYLTQPLHARINNVTINVFGISAGSGNFSTKATFIKPN